MLPLTLFSSKWANLTPLAFPSNSIFLWKLQFIWINKYVQSLILQQTSDLTKLYGSSFATTSKQSDCILLHLEDNYLIKGKMKNFCTAATDIKTNNIYVAVVTALCLHEAGPSTFSEVLKSSMNKKESTSLARKFSLQRSPSFPCHWTLQPQSCRSSIKGVMRIYI